MKNILWVTVYQTTHITVLLLLCLYKHLQILKCRLTQLRAGNCTSSDMAAGVPLCCGALTRNLDPWQQQQNKIWRHEIFTAKHLWMLFQEEQEQFLFTKPCSWKHLNLPDIQPEASLVTDQFSKNEHRRQEQAGNCHLNMTHWTQEGCLLCLSLLSRND